MIDLRDFDLIVINTSGGKDSQAMLAHVHHLARLTGTLDRLMCVHADLGDMEWPGTGEIARAQAEHFGVCFEVCSRIGRVAARNSSTYEAGEVYGDILDYARRRGSWPSSSARWCTSEFNQTRTHRTNHHAARSQSERAQGDCKRYPRPGALMHRDAL